MRPVPFIWVWRKKPLDDVGILFLYKARCCLRGDCQHEFFEYDPDFIYAPVAAHESIRTIVAFAAAHGLTLEGADISNAYLYGNLDIPIIMEQPTDSSQFEAKPSMYVNSLSLFTEQGRQERYGVLSYAPRWKIGDSSLPNLIPASISFGAVQNLSSSQSLSMTWPSQKIRQDFSTSSSKIYLQNLMLSCLVSFVLLSHVTSVLLQAV